MELQLLKSLPLNLAIARNSRYHIVSLSDFRSAPSLAGHRIDYGKVALDAILLANHEDLFAAFSGASSAKNACHILRVLNDNLPESPWIEGDEPQLATVEDLMAEFMVAQDFRDQTVRLERRANRMSALIVFALLAIVVATRFF
jgi:hypothetical protein